MQGVVVTRSSERFLQRRQAARSAWVQMSGQALGRLGPTTTAMAIERHAITAGIAVHQESRRGGMMIVAVDLLSRQQQGGSRLGDKIAKEDFRHRRMAIICRLVLQATYHFHDRTCHNADQLLRQPALASEVAI